MIVFGNPNTDHEELHQKVRRIQGEAWRGCATLPQHMTVRQSTGDVIIRPRRQPPADEQRPYSTDLSADDTAAFLKAFLVALPGAAESSNVRIPEVLRESLESLLRATEKWRDLTSIKGDVSRESFQIIYLDFDIPADVVYNGPVTVETFDVPTFEAPEPDWNDAKNDRRCELIDKEIEGTLLPAEKRELEELQRQMLAYRRKVAPLPLKEAQRLHQQLLKKATEQED